MAGIAVSANVLPFISVAIEASFLSTVPIKVVVFVLLATTVKCLFNDTAGNHQLLRYNIH